MENTITYYFKPHGEYNQHRYFEKPDAYGQHSGEVQDGYFKASDLRLDGDIEWAGHQIVFKDKIEAAIYCDRAICD